MLPPDLFELLHAADEIESRIVEKNREIEQVRAEPSQPVQEAPAAPAVDVISEATPSASPAQPLQAEPTEIVVQERFFCGECGARAEPGNVFCGKCGAKLQ